MFFSRRLIESLVLSLASDEAIDQHSVRNLLFHLSLPGTEVPYAIADTIVENPEVSSEQNHFSPRLAFGVVEGGLVVFDATQREELHRKLMRKISLIRFGLNRHQFPDLLLDRFERRLNDLFVATLAAQDLALQERPLLAAELATLTERLIECCMIQQEVTLLLLSKLGSVLELPNRRRLAERARFAIDLGLDTPPWDDDAELHVILAEQAPVSFRKSLFEQPAFAPMAHTLVDHLSLSARS